MGNRGEPDGTAKLHRHKPQTWLTDVVRINMAYVIGLLCIVISLLTLNFYDWPPNRDITTYATMAQELIRGKEL